MSVVGVWMIGKYLGAEDAARGDKTRIENLRSVKLDVGRGEHQFVRRCDYWEVDRETGEPTRAAQSFLAATKKVKIGDLVACRVSGRASGKYVNFDLVDLVPLADLVGAPAAAAAAA